MRSILIVSGIAASIALNACDGAPKTPQLAAIASSSPAVDPSRKFDLECASHYVLTIAGKQSTVADNKDVYRVDLDANRWCSLDCKESFPIVAVTDAMLVLEHDADREINAYSDTTISRETGELNVSKRINDTGHTIKGVCTKKPFTELPAKKF